MKIYVGADHRGFEAKEGLKAWLAEQGHTVVDCGNTELNPDDDYVDFAQAVAKKVLSEDGSLGIVLCGSGAGVSIAANRFKGIRCGVAITAEEVAHMRTNDHINMLSLATDLFDMPTLQQFAEVFLQTEANTAPRYMRRLVKLDMI